MITGNGFWLSGFGSRLSYWAEIGSIWIGGFCRSLLPCLAAGCRNAARENLGGTGERLTVYQIVLVLAAVLALVGAAILRATTRKKHPAKRCAQCGKPSSHGYAKAEPEPSETAPLCVDCLLRRLDEDYCTYDGRAVVVQPVAELPRYVFLPTADWKEAVRNDVDFLLAGLQTHCHSCGQPARYVWVNALEPGPVAKLPELGIQHTLLAGGKVHPVSLCAQCTVKRIGHSLREQEGGYLEICGPRGDADGLVSGAGY